MGFSFQLPTPGGLRSFVIEVGTSLYFVGANGGGKTRLAVHIETNLGANAHRISAHRALNLNPSVAKVSEAEALQGLKIGISNPGYGSPNRVGSRWSSKAAVGLLNDYDFLVQALFAEQSNTALQTHRNAREGKADPISSTNLEKLVEIWDRVLPHRKLHITGDDIQVSVVGYPDKYPASEMSDGERAIFYLIGQILTAEKSSLILFDEPELHIHRSVVARLWDELEAARPDCGMVIISHDLEFVASRKGKTYVLREYQPSKGWTIEDVPEDSGFSEELTSLILGSRKPILFVEGRNESLDQAVYRACYPDWTIVPRSSCEEVIHAVVTMRANAALTRITCSGVVDADGNLSPDDVSYLNGRGIAVLPVSEIENLFLLPDVMVEILKSEGFEAKALSEKRDQIVDEVFKSAADPKNQLATVMRYCRRKIDQTLKKVDLSSSSDVAALASDYVSKTAVLDVTELADSVVKSLQSAISSRDVSLLLQWYDNKGLMNIAAKMKSTKRDLFEQWIVRSMRNNTAPAVTKAVQAQLPSIQAS